MLLLNFANLFSVEILGANSMWYTLQLSRLQHYFSSFVVHITLASLHLHLVLGSLLVLLRTR